MTKSGSVDLISISRREAIPKLLAIHSLREQYAVLDDGPPFTIYVSDSWYVIKLNSVFIIIS